MDSEPRQSTHIVSHVPFTLRPNHVDHPAILSELISEKFAEPIRHQRNVSKDPVRKDSVCLTHCQKMNRGPER